MTELEPVSYRVWLKTNRRSGVTVEAKTYFEAKRLGATKLRTNVDNVQAEVVREGESA
jgi:hypothetical protein